MIGGALGFASAALRWIGNNPMVIALVLVSGGYIAKSIHLANTTVKLERAEARATVAEAKVELQNGAIEAFRAIGEAKTEAAELAIEAARQAGSTHVERSKEIMREKVPAPDAECAAARALLEKFQ